VRRGEVPGRNSTKKVGLPLALWEPVKKPSTVRDARHLRWRVRGKHAKGTMGGSGEVQLREAREPWKAISREQSESGVIGLLCRCFVGCNAATKLVIPDGSIFFAGPLAFELA